MISTTSLLVSFGLLFGGIQALPQPAEDFTVAILEHIHASTPIVWHEATDGSHGNFTDIPNDVWDAAIGTVGLQKRQTGLHCHGSGSWAKQRVMTEGIGEACTSLRDTPRGQTRVHRVFGYNAAGDSMDVHYTKRCNIWDSNERTRFDQCRQAADHIIARCKGASQDSRGGTVTGRDSNWYGVDPQTHKCNC